MNDILTRRQTHFVLWCPATVASPPELIIGKLQNGRSRRLAAAASRSTAIFAKS
jgi:pullulanase